MLLVFTHIIQSRWNSLDNFGGETQRWPTITQGIYFIRCLKRTHEVQSAIHRTQ